jgi:hypothetical protein
MIVQRSSCHRPASSGDAAHVTGSGLVPIVGADLDGEFNPERESLAST